MILAILDGATFCAARVEAAESKKPAWQLEWEKTLQEAKKKGQLAI